LDSGSTASLQEPFHGSCTFGLGLCASKTPLSPGIGILKVLALFRRFHGFFAPSILPSPEDGIVPAPGFEGIL
jgi:hypothetical protein